MYRSFSEEKNVILLIFHSQPRKTLYMLIKNYLNLKSTISQKNHTEHTIAQSPNITQELFILVTTKH